MDALSPSARRYLEQVTQAARSASNPAEGLLILQTEILREAMVTNEWLATISETILTTLELAREGYRARQAEEEEE